MNFQMTPDGMEFFALIALLLGLFSTVFWMVVGWRAMRAHERIAESVCRSGGTQGPWARGRPWVSEDRE